MNAKYPITRRLRGFAQTLQTSRLNYGIEKFSDAVCGHAKSWGSNLLAEEPRTKDMAFDDIWALFMIEYNYRKFIKKKPRMAELIEEGVANGILKEGTTFEKMFPANRPPKEIFKGKQCLIPSKFAKVNNEALYRNFFAEDKFPEEDAYLSVQYSNISSFTNTQLEAVNELIVNYIENEFNELSSNGLKNEYWMFAFYLMCKEVEITPFLWDRIKKICFGDDYVPEHKDDYRWRYIYETVLAENKTIRKPTYYSKPNVVYFDNQDAEISATNFPIFNISYDINRMKELMGDDNYENMLDKCVDGKIKLADLFLILYRGNYLNAKVKNKELIFMETCRELLEYDIDVPFYKFDFIEKPYIEKTEFSLETFILNLTIRKLLASDQIKNEEERKLIELFESNLKVGNVKFLKLLAMDFSFISRLTDSRLKILKTEIEEIVTEFKKKNLR